MKCPLCQKDLILDPIYTRCPTNIHYHPLTLGEPLVSHFEFVNIDGYSVHEPPFFIRVNQNKSEVYLYNAKYYTFDLTLTTDYVTMDKLSNFIKRLHNLKAFL